MEGLGCCGRLIDRLPRAKNDAEDVETAEIWSVGRLIPHTLSSPLHIEFH